MASERQIAANRRNAPMSTGPRSRAGLKRASRNAYRHGLSSSGTSDPALAKQLEQLARKIAGDNGDPNIIGRARAIAHAELELVRVRRARVAIIARATTALSVGHPNQLAEAVRRALPELLKLERYERHAWNVRDQAIRIS